MALLIPIPRTNVAALERALDRFATFDWRSRGKIKVFPLDEPSAHIGEFLCEYCQANGIGQVLVAKRVKCGEPTLAEAGYTVIKGSTITALVHGERLQRHLRELGLDWRSEVESRLQSYGLARIGDKEIDNWLLQFEYLNNHRAVGQHLLQLLDVLPLADLGESLSIGADLYDSELVVGFNNDKWGKSWGTVSNLIKKKCPAALLLPIADAIEAGAPPSVLRLVEDGLFSGTESRAILDSLLGTRPAGRSQKVRQLANRSVLSQVSAQFHFGVVCDFGEKILRRYTALNSLPNIQVNVTAAARRIRVLFPKLDMEWSHGGIASDEMGDNAFRTNLRSSVVPFAFQDDKGWRDEVSRDRAKAFCENIGKQLWRNYILKKGFDLGAWPDERISRCALGMEGLGLTFAFPHSVPKASLPLLWASGKVSLNGTSIDWTPLLTNSDG